MLRWVVRRFSGLLALAYTLSFLAVCLGGCLGAAPADHGCCQGKDGLKAGETSKDCCKVVPAVSAKHFAAAIGAPVALMPTARQDILRMMTVAHDPAPAPAAAGPPRVLRI